MHGNPTFAAFLATFRRHWFAAMSGSFSVPFAAAAVYLENKYAQGVFAALAFSATWFAAYSVWRTERKKVIDLEGSVTELFEAEQTIQRLVALQSRGLEIYKSTNQTPEAYIVSLKQWEVEVEQILSENFSISELHSFRTRGFYNGGQYALPVEIPQEWMQTTEKQRIDTSARISALNHIIEYGSSNFLGPRLRLAEWMEKRHYVI